MLRIAHLFIAIGLIIITSCQHVPYTEIIGYVDPEQPDCNYILWDGFDQTCVVHVVEETVREVEVPIEVIVEKIIEVIVIEKEIVEVPVIIEKVRDRIVEVEVPVEVFITEVVEVIKEVYVTEVVTNIVEVEKIIEVEVPVTNIVEVEKIVEVEVPVEVPVVEIREVPVEVIVKEVETVYVDRVVYRDRIVYRDAEEEPVVVVENKIYDSADYLNWVSAGKPAGQHEHTFHHTHDGKRHGHRIAHPNGQADNWEREHAGFEGLTHE